MGIVAKRVILAGAILVSWVGTAQAQQCKDLGDLAFIGAFEDGSGSVWFSTTVWPDPTADWPVPPAAE